MFDSSFSGKRVLLTGHTGFKGAWLAEWLLLLGAEVHGYALDPQPHERLYDQLGLSLRIASDTRADLADRALLGRRLSEIRPNFVLHLAAQPLVRLSYDIPVETFATNVMGTVYVLEALRNYSSQLVPSSPCVAVFITTDKCYENREWLHAYREEDPMGGHDPYSASKGAAELAIASYRRSFFRGTQLRIASARAGNVIGGGDWAADRIIPDCIRALRRGEAIPVRNRIATRPWQHVLEPLSGYLWLAASLAKVPQSGPFRTELSPLEGAFNFGPNLSSNRTVAQLVEQLLEHMDGEWEDRSDPSAVHEASKLNLSTDKAFHLLGWAPVWDFDNTIRHTAEWYLGEQDGKSVRELTRDQTMAYVDDASSKVLSWAQ